MQQTHVVRRSVGKDMSIGMNWLIRSMNGREVVWHNGGTGGYRTWIGFDKTRKIAAIVLDELGRSATTISDSSWWPAQPPLQKKGPDRSGPCSTVNCQLSTVNAAVQGQVAETIFTALSRM